MCLSAWTPNFKLENFKITHDQLWSRKHGISFEHYEPTTLFSIVFYIVTHLPIDELTRKRTWGSLAPMQIDLNMSDILHDRIFAEQVGYLFFFELELRVYHFFVIIVCVNVQNVFNSLRSQNR